MFSSIRVERVDAAVLEEVDDLVCEVLTICERLLSVRSKANRRQIDFWEACVVESDCELLLGQCYEELARLGFELRWDVGDCPEAVPLIDFVARDAPDREDAGIRSSGRDDGLDIAC